LFFLIITIDNGLFSQQTYEFFQPEISMLEKFQYFLQLQYLEPLTCYRVVGIVKK